MTTLTTDLPLISSGTMTMTTRMTTMTAATASTAARTTTMTIMTAAIIATGNMRTEITAIEITVPGTTVTAITATGIIAGRVPGDGVAREALVQSGQGADLAGAAPMLSAVLKLGAVLDDPSVAGLVALVEVLMMASAPIVDPVDLALAIDVAVCVPAARIVVGKDNHRWARQTDGLQIDVVPKAAAPKVAVQKDNKPQVNKAPVRKVQDSEDLEARDSAARHSAGKVRTVLDQAVAERWEAQAAGSAAALAVLRLGSRALTADRLASSAS
jgi:hypothetical protein